MPANGGQTGSRDAAGRFRDARRNHWNEVARRRDHWTSMGAYYHRRLEEIFRHIISPGQRVLEVGCGTGELLAAVRPKEGVGVDLSPEMVSRARERFPDLTFVEADAHDLPLDGTFDAIILSDLINDLWDVQAVFQGLKRFTHPGTRIVMNTYSLLWELPLALAQTLGLSTPLLTQNWLTVDDVRNLLGLSGFEVIAHRPEVLWPLGTRVVSTLLNRYAVRLWPLSHLALTNVIIARPCAKAQEQEPVVSVVVPARNEEGNIEEVFRRTPEMGAGTELVFVEGGSSDDTCGAIERAMKAHPQRRCTFLRQTGKGKGDAVRLGFAHATGEVLMILDADMTVPPEDLPRFYDAIVSGQGEFINGVRLVYPMEKQAMRYFNLVGNKFFSLAFSWLLGQPIKDTLCGTKVLSRENYERIAANRNYFGDFDPFGDFDLLFGAAKQNMKIVEMPIRYRQRLYGDTNIDRWRHGMILLRMVIFAMRRIKFY
jgi:SAM-dependent methyltransferase